jgi:hypothetical protein
VLAVRHTWTQQFNLHPHVHCLVSGGGISEDASTWHPARPKFLVPIKALAKLVCGKFRARLRRKGPDLVIPDAAWRIRWILHVTAWGNGEQAVLDYLARYVFRVALTNARIVGLDNETVSIQYKERKTGHRRTCRLSGEVAQTEPRLSAQAPSVLGKISSAHSTPNAPRSSNGASAAASRRTNS